ncbi:anti-repressor SinI family protein [Ammoniphilus sp. CFH 90114]|nr:anti-repressor SinI family protein [Ammoniphilus sp. CFH 90114]RXS99851.1 DNA-binding anti-repressor SinI [Ammoniphilus sp. CFH 90114]
MDWDKQNCSEDGNELDQEWVYLINTAREMGISADEIRRFFNNQISLST